jgi:hypothetical protein
MSTTRLGDLTVTIVVDVLPSDERFHGRYLAIA